MSHTGGESCFGFVLSSCAPGFKPSKFNGWFRSLLGSFWPQQTLRSRAVLHAIDGGDGVISPDATWNILSVVKAAYALSVGMDTKQGTRSVQDPGSRRPLRFVPSFSTVHSFTW